MSNTLFLAISIFAFFLGIVTVVTCLGICGILIYIFVIAKKEGDPLKISDYFTIIFGEMMFLGLGYAALFSAIEIIKNVIK